MGIAFKSDQLFDIDIERERDKNGQNQKETHRWAVKVAERVFPAAAEEEEEEEEPVAVTVFFGANDACLPNRCSAFQHVPLHEYKQNLHSIVSFLKAMFGRRDGEEERQRVGRMENVNESEDCRKSSCYNRWPTTRILFITPPPIDEDGRLRHPYIENPTNEPERTNEAAGAYAKACVEVAGECGLPVIDLWTKMQQFPDWQNAYLRDGLHLTRSGNQIVFGEVVKKLAEEGLSLETLPVDLPLIFEIDPKDPLKCFQQ
ncbi:hypothetical protein TIFTF001_012794 [Ficus carica]|uniref:SGNH hydrolase-type esterase domain-containing protein n=1 Tax=Ficus carica TaxID=3494 RepID=A0AA88A307_FICCA|nr:hypothetical protein TIFTF001_012794 [Ficus carica]